jgi:hypothetical protein
MNTKLNNDAIVCNNHNKDAQHVLTNTVNTVEITVIDSATKITLGGGASGAETRHRPFGSLC